MTTRELEKHISGLVCVSGEVRYTLTYRGRKYHCTTNDTTLSDRINADEDPEYKTCAGTYRQAYEALYRHGKRQHCLDEQSLKKFSEFVYGVRTL